MCVAPCELWQPLSLILRPQITSAFVPSITQSLDETLSPHLADRLGRPAQHIAQLPAPQIDSLFSLPSTHLSRLTSLASPSSAHPPPLPADELERETTRLARALEHEESAHAERLYEAELERLLQLDSDDFAGAVEHLGRSEQAGPGESTIKARIEVMLQQGREDDRSLELSLQVERLRFVSLPRSCFDSEVLIAPRSLPQVEAELSGTLLPFSAALQDSLAASLAQLSELAALLDALALELESIRALDVRQGIRQPLPLLEEGSAWKGRSDLLRGPTSPLISPVRIQMPSSPWPLELQFLTQAETSTSCSPLSDTNSRSARVKSIELCSRSFADLLPLRESPCR